MKNSITRQMTLKNGTGYVVRMNNGGVGSHAFSDDVTAGQPGLVCYPGTRCLVKQPEASKQAEATQQEQPSPDKK